jgi:hypothetical protein
MDDNPANRTTLSSCGSFTIASLYINVLCDFSQRQHPSSTSVSLCCTPIILPLLSCGAMCPVPGKAKHTVIISKRFVISEQRAATCAERWKAQSGEIRDVVICKPLGLRSSIFDRSIRSIITSYMGN